MNSKYKYHNLKTMTQINFSFERLCLGSRCSQIEQSIKCTGVRCPKVSGRQVSKIIWESSVRASGVQKLPWASSVQNGLGVRCPKCDQGVRCPCITCHGRQVSKVSRALRVQALGVQNESGVRCLATFVWASGVRASCEIHPYQWILDVDGCQRMLMDVNTCYCIYWM